MRRMGVIIVESDEERQYDFCGGSKLWFFEKKIYRFPDCDLVWRPGNMKCSNANASSTFLAPR